jgi:ABC-type nitrate/sulfonate/bicarbonate transport system substrate-binding protein
MNSIQNVMTSIIRAGTVATAVLAISGSVSAQELRAITIGTSSASIPAGAARIAKELGLYEKHGLVAKVTPLDTGAVATAALLSGALDFVTSGPSDVVVAQGRGQDIVALTSGYRGFAASIVISKAAAEKSRVSASAPINDRLKALNGLKIASTSAQSTFTVGLRSSAESVGAKVDVVYMAQPAMIAAFERGIIDGFTVSAPYYVQPVLTGSGLMWVSGPKGDFPKMTSPANSSVLMVKRDFAAANPDLMKRVTSVFTDFWKVVEERPLDVKAAIAKIWPDLDTKTIDLVFETEAPGFKAKPLTVEDMRHDIEFMKNGGIDLPQADRLDPAKMLFP